MYYIRIQLYRLYMYSSTYTPSGRQNRYRIPSNIQQPVERKSCCHGPTQQPVLGLKQSERPTEPRNLAASSASASVQLAEK